MKALLGRLSRRHRKVEPSTATQAETVSALTPAQYVEAALVHHGAGRLREAEALYRKALEADADCFDALHLLGVLHHQNGESASAVESIEQAIKVAPENHAAHSNLGLAYQALNRLDRAEVSLRRAVALRADWDTAHNNLGTVMQATGRLEEAEACFRKALQLNPSSAEALNNLGNLCKERGQFADADQLYRKGLAVDSTRPELWKNLGQALRQCQRLDEAAECYRKALALRPEDGNVLIEIGMIHQARAQLGDAAQCFELALQRDGNLVEAMWGLAGVLGHLDRFDEAELYCRKALAIRPDDPAALNNLAAVLLRTSALDDAERFCRKALSARGDHAPTLITMGCILNARDRSMEAEACFLQAMRLSPVSAPAKYNLSILKLLRGDYNEGLKLYESRFDALQGDIGCKPQILELLHDNRRWGGEALSGQRLLIWAEQGFGDSLMMLRYLPLLKCRGAGEIRVLCELALERIVYSVCGLDHSVSCAQTVSANDFDLHCPIMSLPLLFGTTLDSIPNQVPYIAVPRELGNAWKERLSPIAKTKVGLAWAGSKTLRADARRSIPLAALEPVIRCEGVQLVSLQKEEGAEQLRDWRGQIADWMDDCTDFLDTAALVDNLDLVISVDSAIVHLAGALGKPVWLLNRHGSEWRWGLESANSPWYPTMRIFRQREAETWDRVSARVADELTHFLST
jgi:Tfp pilus assembly protein PilF